MNDKEYAMITVEQLETFFLHMKEIQKILDKKEKLSDEEINKKLEEFHKQLKELNRKLNNDKG